MGNLILALNFSGNTRRAFHKLSFHGYDYTGGWLSELELLSLTLRVGHIVSDMNRVR